MLVLLLKLKYLQVGDEYMPKMVRVKAKKCIDGDELRRQIFQFRAWGGTVDS